MPVSREDELAELHHQHELGHLEQTCPNCGLNEAAGRYCSRCHTITEPDSWNRRRKPKKEETSDGEQGDLPVDV